MRDEWEIFCARHRVHDAARSFAGALLDAAEQRTRAACALAVREASAACRGRGTKLDSYDLILLADRISNLDT